MNKNSFKFFSYFLLTTLLTLGLSIAGQSLLAAWTAPHSIPPICITDPSNPNYDEACNEPLNKGSSAQIKGGPLLVNFNNSPAAPFGLATYGKIGIGTITPQWPLDVVVDVNNYGTINVTNLNAGSNAFAELQPTNDLGHSGGVGIGGSGTTDQVFRDRIFLGSGSSQGISVVSEGGDIRFIAGGDQASNEKMRILANGNVGIGLTAPVYQTQIRGAGQTVSALADSGNKGGMLFVQDSGAVGGNGGALLFGANVSTANAPQAGIKLLLTNGTSQGIGDLAFMTRNAVSDTALTERVRILSDGNVGIGAPAPSYKLDVNGDINFTGNLRQGGTIIPLGGTSGWTNDGTVVRLTTITNNVGIGTAAPLAKLQVKNGKAFINQMNVDPSVGAYSAADLVLGDNINTRDGYGGTNGSHIFLQSSDKSSITALDESNNLGQISYQNLEWTIGEDIGWGAQTVYLPGSVGIGVPAPSQMLDVAGRVTIAPSGTAPDNGYNGNLVITKPPLSGQHINLIRNLNYGWSLGYVYNTNNFAIGTIQAVDSDFSSPRFAIGTDGNVGIGAAFPNTKLNLFDNASGPIINLQGLTANYRGVKIADIANNENWFSGANSSNNFVVRRSGSTDDLTIDSSGDVGIGAINPGVKLDVAGTIRTTAEGYASLGRVCGAAGTQCVNFHNNSWIYISDTNGNVYGGQGLAADKLWAQNQICLAGDCKTAWNQVTGAVPTLQQVTTQGATTNLTITTAGLNLNGSGTEGNISAINQLIGFDDIFIKGNADETMPVYLGGNQISAYTSSIERLRIDAAGNVGIGTVAAPQAKLQILTGTGSGVVTEGLRLSTNDATYAIDSGVGIKFFYSDNNKQLAAVNSAIAVNGNGGYGYLSFGTRSSDALGVQEKMRITYDGNVGIGTPGPGAKLEVIDSSAVDTTPLVVTNNFGTPANQAAASIKIGRTAATAWASITGKQQVASDYNYGQMFFGTKTSDATGIETKMTILSNGNVGIGTVNPGAKLEIAGQVKITGGTPGANKVLTTVDGSGLATWETPAGGAVPNLQQVTTAGATANLTITTAGLNLNGSGTEGNISAINQLIGFDDIFIKGNSSETKSVHIAGDQVFIYTNPGTGGVERMRIDASGNVGIGAPALAEKLEVTGNIKLSGATPTYKIMNLADPTLASDAATMGYVDSMVNSGGGYKNIATFNSSGAWTVPAGVTTVMVELWSGGNGGGGGLCAGNGSGDGNSGGIGGSYNRGSVSVTPGDSLTVVVGAGGAGGAGGGWNGSWCFTNDPGSAGGAGGATQLKKGAAVLISNGSGASSFNLSGSYGEQDQPSSCSGSSGYANGGEAGIAANTPLNSSGNPGQGGAAGGYNCNSNEGSAGEPGLAGRMVIYY